VGRPPNSILVALLATAVFAIAASAATGARHAAAPTYTIEYDGKGTYTRTATAPSGCGSMASSDKSEFSWDITWKNVTMAATDKGPVPVVGSLHGINTQNYDGFDQSTIGCPKQTNHCSGPFAANQAHGASYPATLRIVKTAKGYRIVTTVVNSPSNQGNWKECPSVAINESYEKYLILSIPTEAGKTIDFPPLQAYPVIPYSALSHAGKSILVVKDGTSNYPGVQSNCNIIHAPQTTCTHSQSWTGHVTITRNS
jgi:hypothetical protein